jgi:hypothetical protein
MILCHKCGKVKEYGIKEYIHRVGIFNENNECVETKVTNMNLVEHYIEKNS